MRWSTSCDQRESPKRPRRGYGLTEEEIAIVKGLDHK